MGVRAEALARRDGVVVDDPEAPISHVLGIVVVSEGEGMPGVQPAVIGVAAVHGAAHRDRGNGDLLLHGHRMERADDPANAGSFA